MDPWLRVLHLSREYLFDGRDDEVRLLELDLVVAARGDNLFAVGRETGEVLLQSLPGCIDLRTSRQHYQWKAPQGMSSGTDLGGTHIKRRGLIRNCLAKPCLIELRFCLGLHCRWVHGYVSIGEPK